MCGVKTRQSLPSKEYREILGTAICVFNSNNAFIIENILRNDDESEYDWYTLIDKTSGQLAEPIRKKINKKEIADLFEELTSIRNRIVHSFQFTDVNKDGKQRLATKTKANQQFIITEELLVDFIANNEKLSLMLHEFRGV